jgi:hypothetical protein
VGVELAEYTEANDRLYLGKKANKAAARRMKGEIGEMIADRLVGAVSSQVELMVF